MAKILRLNLEWLTPNKIYVLSKLATRHKALVILLLETHYKNADQQVILHFTLAGSVSNRKHYLATFAHEKLSWTLVDKLSDILANEWLCVDIDGCKIVNVYKPPTLQLTLIAIPVFPCPCLYASNSNCHHTERGYNYTIPYRECLADWEAKKNLSLLYNPKNGPSFFSGRWNTISNPDLVFASEDLNSSKLDRHTLKKFPRSQHRPSLIKVSKNTNPVPI